MSMGDGLCQCSLCIINRAMLEANNFRANNFGRKSPAFRPGPWVWVSDHEAFKPELFNSDDGIGSYYTRLVAETEKGYQRKRNTLIAYLKEKTEESDWHGVSDAANDLRVLEAGHAAL